jgi:hypothetical protein
VAPISVAPISVAPISVAPRRIQRGWRARAVRRDIGRRELLLGLLPVSSRQRVQIPPGSDYNTDSRTEHTEVPEWPDTGLVTAYSVRMRGLRTSTDELGARF